MAKKYYSYYLSLEHFTNSVNLFDNIGVPLVSDAYGNINYNPVTIAQYGIGNLDLFDKTKKRIYYNNAKNILKWLNDNKTKTGNGFGWYYYYSNPWYPINVPYLSGMAQGQIISFYVRQYYVTYDYKYINQAKYAFNAMKLDVKKGGTKNNFKEFVWIEEIPSFPASYILNGYIFAIFGVYDLYKATKDDYFLNIFNSMLDTLEFCLPYYDTGYWSYYDLYHYFPSSLKYHKIHIEQLNVLYNLSRKKVFNLYSKLFQIYLKNTDFKKIFTLRKIKQINYLLFNKTLVDLLKYDFSLKQIIT